MFFMMGARFLSGDLEILASLVLLDFFPGYSIWCAFGALITLFAPKPLDRTALWSNLVVGVLTAIPFVLISMGFAHVRF